VEAALVRHGAEAVEARERNEGREDLLGLAHTVDERAQQVAARLLVAARALAHPLQEHEHVLEQQRRQLARVQVAHAPVQLALVHQPPAQKPQALCQQSKVHKNRINHFGVTPRGYFFCILWNIGWGGGGQKSDQK